MRKEIKQLNELRKKSLNMRLAAESWKSDFQILISTILSARTRDEMTIPIATKLFQKYPSVKFLSKAKLSDIEKIIKPINFYKNKSKNIINCSKQIIEGFNGKVPHDFEKLTKLSGVGRKTANVFLSEVGKDEIGIDTHVFYISRFLGWTRNSNSEKIENDLKKLFPKRYWKKINPLLVRFGKTYTSRKKKDELLNEIKKIK